MKKWLSLLMVFTLLLCLFAIPPGLAGGPPDDPAEIDADTLDPNEIDADTLDPLEIDADTLDPNEIDTDGMVSINPDAVGFWYLREEGAEGVDLTTSLILDEDGVAHFVPGQDGYDGIWYQDENGIIHVVSDGVDVITFEVLPDGSLLSGDGYSFQRIPAFLMDDIDDSYDMIDPTAPRSALNGTWESLYYSTMGYDIPVEKIGPGAEISFFIEDGKLRLVNNETPVDDLRSDHFRNGIVVWSPSVGVSFLMMMCTNRTMAVWMTSGYGAVIHCGKLS